MQLEQEKNRWNEKSISIIRDGYLSRLAPASIIDQLRVQCGFEPTPKALETATGRFCAEERHAREGERKEKLDENRAKARGLIAAGRTVSEIADILQVPQHRIYDWIPGEQRPNNSTVREGIVDWLSRFVPTAVPDDPIIDHGKLITDLGVDDCRWPIGKDADGLFRFCGCQFHRTQSARKERPYCEAHVQIDVKTKYPDKTPTQMASFRRNVVPNVFSLADAPVNMMSVDCTKLAA